MIDYQVYLGKQVTIDIDRPIGSLHPKHQYRYPLNYGYVPNTQAEDGSEIDVYLLDCQQPLTTANVVIIGVAIRHDDDENKLIASLDGSCPTLVEVKRQLWFQEQYFHTDYELITNSHTMVNVSKY
jgi:inorganic pyrophosphatase